MGYHIDDRSMSLDALRARLEATDLIPSHQALLDGLATKMRALKKGGIQSIAELRIRLKTKKSLASLADDSGVDADYLVLLRRAVEGFFPKPQRLKVFDWLDKGTVAKLEAAGVKNTLQLYEAASADAASLTKKADIKRAVLSELMALCDLSRVQWASPIFARTLIAAGFTNAAKVSDADPKALYQALMRANEGARFYKGTVGLRDIKRLVAAAAYVQER